MREQQTTQPRPLRGRVPEDWTVAKLQDLTTKIVDGVHKTPEYKKAGVPFLTVENLTRGDGISLNPCRYVSRRDHEAFFKRADPKPGDVLVSKDGTLGVARVVPEEMPEFSIFVSVAQLRPDTRRILSEMVFKFFDSGEYERQLGKLSAGTGLKHIHLEH
jgi:type I restriction enzyme, S subunit